MSDEDFAKKKKGKQRITPAQWAEIEELYALGEMTVEQLAEKYDLHPVYISRVLSKRGVKKNSRAAEIQDKVREAVHQQRVAETADLMKKIAETKEEHYKYAKTISALAFKLVAQQVQGLKPLAAIKDDIKTLREAMATIELGRVERFAVLGLDKDDSLGEENTTLVIEEMTDEDVEALREQQKSQFSDELEEIDSLMEELENDDMGPSDDDADA